MGMSVLAKSILSYGGCPQTFPRKFPSVAVFASMAATPPATATALAAALTLMLAQAIDWTQDGWVDHGLGLSEIGVRGDLGLRKIRGSGA